MAIQPETYALPPSPFIQQFAEKLRYGPLDILDVGCCMGRNALYLANQGHVVVGISNQVEELMVGKELAKGSVQFVAGDARQLPIRGQFDVVVMNEVLHQLTKPEGWKSIQILQELTKPGGFHAVSDYTGNHPAALGTFELRQLYAKQGWEVIEYYEEPETGFSFGEEDLISSLATIVAAKI